MSRIKNRTNREEYIRSEISKYMGMARRAARNGHVYTMNRCHEELMRLKGFGRVYDENRAKNYRFCTGKLWWF